MLSIKHLTYSYGYNEIFSDASFEAHSNQLTAVMSESGSGKSTLLDIISLKYGIVFDYEYHHCFIKNSGEMLDNIYYLKQNTFLPESLKVKDIWGLLIERYNPSFDLDLYIKRLQLEKVTNSYSKQLSGGERQRVILINALIINKPVLLADEPTASLDIEMKQVVFDILNEFKINHIVIVTSHDDNFSNSDVVYNIEDKKLIKIKDCFDDGEVVNNQIETRKVNWFKCFFKIKRYHLLLSITSSVIISLIVGIFSYVMFSGSNINILNKGLDQIENSKIIVYKAINLADPYIFYDNDCVQFPINNNEKNEIIEISDADKVMEKHVLMVDYNDEIDECKIQIIKDNKSVFDLKEFDGSYCNLEGYDLSRKYDQIDYFGNDEGVYLNSDLVQSFGLSNEDINGAKIALVIALPQYDVSGFSSLSFVGNIEIPSNTIKTKRIKIEVPIAGVVNGILPNTVSTTMNQMLISNDYLDKLIKDNLPTDSKTVYYSSAVKGRVDSLEEATETTVYTPYQSNLIELEFDNASKLNLAIKKLQDKGYSVYSKYLEYETVGNNIIKTKETYFLIVSFVLLFVVAVLCVKQIIKSGSEKGFNNWLYSLGFNEKRDILVIKSKKYLLDFMIHSFLSIVILVCLIDNTLYITGNIYIGGKIVYFIPLIVCFVVDVIIPMIWEVCYDKD